jgi:1,4-dihydroxy-2-naphthoyl-CoA hydrolase
MTNLQWCKNIRRHYREEIMQSQWFNPNISLEDINKVNANTMMEVLEIKYTEIGTDYIVGTMPVSSKTVQPLQKLHGGASCVLAETLGSVASNMIIDYQKQAAFGQSITTQHLRPGNMGELVTGKATLLHRGSKTHLWNIDITNQENKLVSTTRLTMAIINR